jgi:hypothetical protein
MYKCQRVLGRQEGEPILEPVPKPAASQRGVSTTERVDEDLLSSTPILTTDESDQL